MAQSPSEVEATLLSLRYVFRGRTFPPPLDVWGNQAVVHFFGSCDWVVFFCFFLAATDVATFLTFCEESEK